jgi:hypothetical protein
MGAAAQGDARRSKEAEMTSVPLQGKIPSTALQRECWVSSAFSPYVRVLKPLIMLGIFEDTQDTQHSHCRDPLGIFSLGIFHPKLSQLRAAIPEEHNQCRAHRRCEGAWHDYRRIGDRLRTPGATCAACCVPMECSRRQNHGRPHRDNQAGSSLLEQRLAEIERRLGITREVA